MDLRRFDFHWWRRLRSAAYGRLPLLLILTACVINLFVSLIGTPKNISVFSETRDIVARLNASYDEKMMLRLGRYYELMNFVVDHTDSEAQVLIPSVLDRGGMTIYLLYPRRWSTYDGELAITECEVNMYILIDTSLPQLEFAASVRVVSSVTSIQGDIKLVLANPNEDGCR